MFVRGLVEKVPRNVGEEWGPGLQGAGGPGPAGSWWRRNKVALDSVRGPQREDGDEAGVQTRGALTWLRSCLHSPQAELRNRKPGEGGSASSV